MRDLDMLRVIAGDDDLLAIEQSRLAAAAAPRADRASGTVSVLALTGVLFGRSRDGWSGRVPGMDAFRARLAAAVADNAVSAIVIDVDSPGGTVGGTAETAAAVRAAAAAKPVVAVANGLAASAAYWIAAQARELVVAPGGEVGSIGVYGMHVDASGLYEKWGLKPTVVSAGKFKAEGLDIGPLTDEARAAWQARIDDAYEAFVADVAAGRKASAKRVREGFGEGRVVTAAAAVAAGMADRVATLDEVVAGLAAGTGKAWRAPRRSALAFY